MDKVKSWIIVLLLLLNVGLLLVSTSHAYNTNWDIKTEDQLMDYYFQSPEELLKARKQLLKKFNKSFQGKKRFSYVVPNEWYPDRVQSIIKYANPGVILSTGGERSFFDASYSSNTVTSLITLDRHPDIIIYNTVNAQLFLLASSSMEKYLELRYSVSFYDWKMAIAEYYQQHQIQELSFSQKFNQYFTGKKRMPLDFLKNEEVFQLWKSWQEKIKPIVDSVKGPTYLNNEKLWSKLNSLSHKIDGMVSILADFSDERAMSELAFKISQKGWSLSVFDLSNAWGNRYMSDPEVLKLVDVLNTLASDKSIFITTQQKFNNINEWLYSGFNFDYLNTLIKKATSENLPLARVFSDPDNLESRKVEFNPSRLGIKYQEGNRFVIGSEFGVLMNRVQNKISLYFDRGSEVDSMVLKCRGLFK